MNPAFVDGPFKASEKPWLLENQRRLGVAVQTMIDGTGNWTQPHGYMRGAKSRQSMVMNQEVELARTGYKAPGNESQFARYKKPKKRKTPGGLTVLPPGKMHQETD